MVTSPQGLGGQSKRIASGKPPDRIDGLMIASLTYVLWFGLLPVNRLAG